MNRILHAVTLACIWWATPAFALEPLPFNVKLGDDVATVKAKLKTEIDPEPMPRNPTLPANVPDVNAGKTILHLRTKGVWVVFDKGGTAQSMRFDAPFDGSIKGIKVGDSEKTLVSTLGKPLVKPGMAVGNMTAYRYVLDDSAYVTFDLNDDGVQFMLINK